MLPGPPFDGRPGTTLSCPGQTQNAETSCRTLLRNWLPDSQELFLGDRRGGSDVGIETGSYDAALHMAGIENYNVLLYTSVLPPEAVESHTCLTSTMDPCSKESSLSSIPISPEHGSQPACFWPRFIAVRTVRTWAVLRASMPAADRSKKRRPIYGKRCSSFLRGVIKTKLYKLEIWEIDSSDFHAGKVVRDDSWWHRLRQLPRAGIKTRSGCNPFPQRQVAREIHDQVKSPASTLLFQPEEAVEHAQISIQIVDPPASKWTTSYSQVQRSSLPARSLEDTATCYGSSSGVSLLRLHFGVGR